MNLQRKQYNLLAGSATGSIKGVTVSKDGFGIKAKIKTCINNPQLISNENEITFMNWSKNAEDILIGMKGRMKIFDLWEQQYSFDLALNTKDAINGLFERDEYLVLGYESGNVRLWKYPYNDNEWSEFKAGSSIERMRQSLIHSNVAATGGNENDLKIWDLNTSGCIFNAKNIKPDELQLRIPVWISDITFFPDNEQIASCTRHGYVRLYDPRLSQRRPIVNAQLQEQVFTCICNTPQQSQLLVGSGSGDLHHVDLRGKGLFVGKYKGFSGAVKSVVCTNSEPLVASVSLDRHFRIHDFHSRKLLVQEYMMSRLTFVLAQKDFKLEEPSSDDVGDDEIEYITSKKRPKIEPREDYNKHEDSDDDETLDKLFKNLEKVEETVEMRLKKLKEENAHPNSAKNKKSKSDCKQSINSSTTKKTVTNSHKTKHLQRQEKETMCFGRGRKKRKAMQNQVKKREHESEDVIYEESNAETKNIPKIVWKMKTTQGKQKSDVNKIKQ